MKLSDINSDILPRSPVLKYYLYRAVGGPGFIAPVYILYVLANGVSFAELGVIGAIQSGIVLVGEIPTGYVGDRIGRRNSLLIGQLLYAVSALGLIVGDEFIFLALAFATLSFGQTFVSGSGDAWLYDILKELMSEDDFTQVRGRGGAIGKWVTAVTMILGALLYAVKPVYPFVALLVMRLVTFCVALSMPQNVQYTDDPDDDHPDDDDLTIIEAIPIIRKRLTTPPVGAFVIYMALFLGVTMTVGVYVQPITRGALETYAAGLFSYLGVGEAASLGLLYAAFTATSAIASDHASTLEEALGTRETLIAIPFAAVGKIAASTSQGLKDATWQNILS
ncbi:MAG: MFS transporter, partial [Halobacteriaceae archaeon]